MIVAEDLTIPWQDGRLGKAQSIFTEPTGQPILGQQLDVACASPKFCLASEGPGFGPVNATWDGTHWKPIPVSGAGQSTGPDAIGNGQLTCPAPGTCWTILQDGSEGGDPVLGSWTGTTWAPVTLNTNGEIVGEITCASADYCLALGNSGGVWTYSGGSWSGPVQVGASTDIACTVGPFCLATAGFSGTVLEDHGNGFAKVSLPNLYAPGVHACGSAAFCLVKRVSNLSAALPQALAGATLTDLPDASAADAFYRNIPIYSCLPNKVCLGVGINSDVLNILDTN